jgi:hypothetical protein
MMQGLFGAASTGWMMQIGPMRRQPVDGLGDARAGAPLPRPDRVSGDGTHTPSAKGSSLAPSGKRPDRVDQSRPKTPRPELRSTTLPLWEHA